MSVSVNSQCQILATAETRILIQRNVNAMIKNQWLHVARSMSAMRLMAEGIPCWFAVARSLCFE